MKVILALGLMISFSGIEGLFADEISNITHASLKVQIKIAESRGAIYKKDQRLALEDLKQCQVLLDKMKDEQPSSLTRDRILITIKHLEFEETNEVIPDLSVLLNELSSKEAIEPRSQTRKFLTMAKENLEIGNREGTKHHLREALDSLDLKQTESSLDKTNVLLNSAKTSIQRRKFAEADRLLKTAESLLPQ